MKEWMNECLRRECFLWNEASDLLSQPTHLEARSVDLQWGLTLFTARSEKDPANCSGAPSSLKVTTVERLSVSSGVSLLHIQETCLENETGWEMNSLCTQLPSAPLLLFLTQFKSDFSNEARETDKEKNRKQSQLWTNTIKFHSKWMFPVSLRGSFFGEWWCWV